MYGVVKLAALSAALAAALVTATETRSPRTISSQSDRLLIMESTDGQPAAACDGPAETGCGSGQTPVSRPSPADDGVETEHAQARRPARTT